jgi:hypothetical protein
MVLMTVTEVTTRIAIVGVAGIIGLLLVSRAQLLRRHEPAVGGHRRFARHSASPVTAGHLPLGRAALRRSGTISSRALGLVVMTIAVGLSVGIGLSVALVAALGALGLEGG